MSEPIISVENLGKCYQIGNSQERGYTALRDVVANKAKSIFKRNTSSFKITEDFWALKDINFEIEQGQAVGIIGRNGAGKSTLLKLLSRITEPTTGRITLNGRVASLLEVGTGFHPELTGRENIYLNGAILGMRRSEIKAKFDEIVDFSGVEKFLDTPVKRYSSGMYVRLAFAVAAHLEPEILVVDEVLAVGDAEFQKKCLGKMEDVSKSGRTVLFVSHNIAAIEALCTKCVLLNQGQVEAVGPTRDITQLYLQSAQSSKNSFNQTFSDNGSVAQITQLEFLSDNRHTDILFMGDDLEIRLSYKTDVVLESPMMGIVLYDAMDAPLLFFNNKNYGVYFDANSSKTGVFTIKINDLNLMPGFYSLDIYFADQFKDLDIKKRCFTFQVVYKHPIEGGEMFNDKNNRIFYNNVNWNLIN